MKIAGIKRCFLFILLAFLISAGTVVLIPFSMTKDGNLNVLGYIAGILFWSGLIVGSVGYLLLYRSQRDVIIGQSNGRIPGIFRFFSNTPAIVMDVILIISVIGTIYCTRNVTASQTISVIFLLMTLVGVYAHCLLNGKIYQYIRNYKNKDTRVIQGKRKE